jgi:hypothetical protein
MPWFFLTVTALYLGYSLGWIIFNQQWKWIPDNGCMFFLPATTISLICSHNVPPKINHLLLAWFEGSSLVHLKGGDLFRPKEASNVYFLITLYFSCFKSNIWPSGIIVCHLPFDTSLF